MITNEDIQDKLTSLADDVREYVRQQLSDWQKIPYLVAKMFCVLGREEFVIPNMLRAFKFGIYSLSGNPIFSNYPTCCVNVINGELVKLDFVRQEARLVPDHIIIDLLQYEMLPYHAKGILNAQLHLNHLEMATAEAEKSELICFADYIRIYNLQKNSYNNPLPLSELV